MKTVLIKEDIVSRNNERAKDVREMLKSSGVFYVNVMSSPGAGKTTLLTKLIPALSREFRVGVIEADIDSDKDALTVERETGARTIQMHTGGACHITCQMSLEALEALGTDGLDVIFLENIGNLVCPAEFDTGADMNLVLLSVPEGDDKPLKYPLMYQVSDVVLINKIDAMDYFDFDLEKAKARILALNPRAVFFPISAKTGEGMDALCGWVLREVEAVKAGRL